MNSEPPYRNVLITPAPDSPAEKSEVPGLFRGKRTKHGIEYELLHARPYRYGHESLTFEVYLEQKALQGLSEAEKRDMWEVMFAKGHPCMRASALTKKCGFGAHYDAEGRIALYPIESEAYARLLGDEEVQKIPAMRNKR